MAMAVAATVNEPTLSEVDQLFATLDGVTVSSEHGPWHSRVQGIHADGPYLWLQLQRDEDDAHTAVLRLPRWITLDAILAVLPSVRFGDESTPQIVSVPQFG